MRLFSFALVLLFTSCAPSAKPPPIPSQVPTTTGGPSTTRPAGTTALSEPQVSPVSTASAAMAATSQTATSQASEAVVPCGLPAALRARGWPEELKPVAGERPDTPDPARVTIAVLPDTQYYTSCRYAHFANQVHWLTENAGALNLKAAIHLGDITESNVPEEWAFARDALKPLLDVAPTFMATGNHDHGELGTANRHSTRFSEFFTPLAAPTAATLAATAVAGDQENAYYRLVLPKVTIGVLVLGWSPQEASVKWANHVLTQFPKDRVIFVTHAYLYTDSTRYDWVGRGAEQEWNPNAYGVVPPDPAVTTSTTAASPRPTDRVQRDVYDGERLWTALISRHKGIFLTLNGHVLHHGTGRLTSTGKHGNEVQQVLVNYQMLSEGGSGYLRLMEIAPDGSALRFRTYSPSLRQWAVAPDQHFELPIKPALW